MAHGQPDFGMYAAKATVGSDADNAELAARLKSINTYDRRGDVVWFDDFESSLNKWRDRGVDLGHGAVISNAAARNGGFSCLLTTGSDGLFQGILSTFKPPPVLSKVGLEVHWTRPAFNFTSIDIRLAIIHPTIAWDARIQFLSAGATLQYWDGAAMQTIEAGVGSRSDTLLFNPLKFVIDLQNNRYERLMFHHRTWDLSAIPCPIGAGAAATETLIDISAVGANGFNVGIHLDDVILTQNEP